MYADFVQFRRNGYGKCVDQIFPVAFRPPRCVSTITGLPPRPDAPRDAARIAFECGFDRERNCQVEAAGSNGNGSTNLCLLFTSRETEINSLQLSSTAWERRGGQWSSLILINRFSSRLTQNQCGNADDSRASRRAFAGIPRSGLFHPVVWESTYCIPNILICFLYLHSVFFCNNHNKETHNLSLISKTFFLCNVSRRSWVFPYVVWIKEHNSNRLSTLFVILWPPKWGVTQQGSIPMLELPLSIPIVGKGQNFQLSKKTKYVLCLRLARCAKTRFTTRVVVKKCTLKG